MPIYTEGLSATVIGIIVAVVVVVVIAISIIIWGISTSNTLRIKYTITMPGLILDNDNLAAKIVDNELMFYDLNGEKLYLPNQDSKYTVIEPMRISDFMEINYKASKSLNETNEKIAEILSDEMISELKTTTRVVF